MLHELRHRCCDQGPNAPTAEELSGMYDSYRRIPYAQFANFLGVKETRRVCALLRYNATCRLQDDYAVQFNRAIFRGQKVVVLEWSRIDHIFCPVPRTLKKVARAQNAPKV